MSDTEKDKEFYEMADAHIAVANEQTAKSINSGKVSATILYSAARFNTCKSCCKIMKYGIPRIRKVNQLLSGV